MRCSNQKKTGMADTSSAIRKMFLAIETPAFASAIKKQEALKKYKNIHESLILSSLSTGEDKFEAFGKCHRRKDYRIVHLPIVLVGRQQKYANTTHTPIFKGA